MRKQILFSVFLVFSIVTAFAQTIPYGNNKTVGKYYEVNGIKLYTEVYGRGKPLLLIHGNGGSIASFSKNIPYFSKYYKVIAVDSRAQGKSVDSSDKLNYEMMADDFAELLKIMKIDSAYVLGWSDGGINAILLAMRHPEKVRKLASTGANMRPDSLALLPSEWKKWQKDYDEKKGKVLTDDKEKNDFKLFSMMMVEPNYTNESLKAVKCPALIIAGDHDLITPEHTVEIFKNIPKAELWIMPDTGHDTLIKRATEFNRKVHEFFRK